MRLWIELILVLLFLIVVFLFQKCYSMAFFCFWFVLSVLIHISLVLQSIIQFRFSFVQPKIHWNIIFVWANCFIFHYPQIFHIAICFSLTTNSLFVKVYQFHFCIFIFPHCSEVGFFYSLFKAVSIDESLKFSSIDWATLFFPQVWTIYQPIFPSEQTSFSKKCFPKLYFYWLPELPHTSFSANCSYPRGKW